MLSTSLESTWPVVSASHAAVVLSGVWPAKLYPTIREDSHGSAGPTRKPLTPVSCCSCGATYGDLQPRRAATVSNSILEHGHLYNNMLLYRCPWLESDTHDHDVWTAMTARDPLINWPRGETEHFMRSTQSHVRHFRENNFAVWIFAGQ